ncbi:MAG: hybrid sensor histidine kinase/response regulator [Desulfobacterium sp.]|nr:hybrid sensor histidine kinase/response regulator [Desulfobacterium sp.]
MTRNLNKTTVSRDLLIQEISERQKTEDALKKSEATLKSIFRVAPIGIGLVAERVFLWVNDQLCSMIGYDREEIVGRSARVIYPSQEEFHRVGMEKYDQIRNHGTGTIETRWQHKDGRIIDVLLSSTPLDPTDFSSGVTFTALDITEQKKSEQERQKLEDRLRQAYKMEAVGTMAGGIAHEFNNILGIILGNAELAIDDVPEWNPAKHSLEEIQKASLRGRDVVRQILSFARISPVTRKPIRISTVIQESLKFVRATIPSSITIRQNILCDAEMILANPTEINQIFINLCSNSAHAIDQETGTISINLETVILTEESAAQYEDLSPGKHIRLSVTDTGKGIRPEIMGRIFDPYFTTKDVDKGLGMGLAVVYGLVKKHDGAIKFVSEVGKGTTAEVLFPTTEELPEIQTKELEDLPGGNERILIVDDEESLVAMVSEMLERKGYEVVGKTSSFEALTLFRKEYDIFDLIITDMAMPEMTGERLTQELLLIRPDIPVILCTGYSERISEEKAKEMGITAYTMKPLRQSALLKTVREVLDEAKSRIQEQGWF